MNPLNDFANRWELDGDYIRCRACNRPQQVSWMLHAFPHAAECPNAAAEINPWLTLSSLINAQISRAKPVCEEAVSAE
jgi:hypothetical protein